MKHLFLGIVLSVLFSCGHSDHSSELSVKPLSKEAALADLEQMVQLFKSLYGPMEFKARNQYVALNFDKAVADAKSRIEASSSDAEVFGAYAKFLRNFRDGHVGISFPLSANQTFRYEIPLFITPVQDKAGEWKAMVDFVDPRIADSGIKVGDVVTKVDGKPVFDYLDTITQYKSNANDVTDRHLIFMVFRREFFMTDLMPTKILADIEYFSKENEKNQFTTLAWNVTKDEAGTFDAVVPTRARGLSVDVSAFNAQAQASRRKMGALEPYFSTPQVHKKYNWKIKGAPSKASLEKFGLKEGEAAPVFAATYEYKGKDILLVRQPGYIPPGIGFDDQDKFMKEVSRWIQTYKAVLYENEGADVLVVDQTHNPGGASNYVFDFFRLFITEPKASLIQLNNVDRLWVTSYIDSAKIAEANNKPSEGRRYRAFAKMIEEADERGDLLSPPVTFDYDYMLNPHEDYSWKKPVLVVTDELAGSCGDIFPMLMKTNGVSEVFGQRTMGLGGNVEEFKLTNSQATVRLTRGLFTTYRADGVYNDDAFVENNGVAPTPGLEYTQKLEDYQAGLVGYVEAFSDKAVSKL